jgi:Cytochrome c3
MQKKTAVVFALFLAFSVLLVCASRAGAAQEQAPPAQNGGAQGSQPAPSQPAAAAPKTEQPAASPKTGTDAAKTAAADDSKKAAFTDDVKPYLSDRHVAKGMECTSCHGDTTPQKPVETPKCLECHTSFDEISKKTVDMSPNPHANHLIDSQDIDCSSCHHAHKANELYCTQCHADMEMLRNSASLQPRVTNRLLALLHTAGIAH